MFTQLFLRFLIKPYLLQLILVVGHFVLLLQFLLPVIILLVKQIFLFIIYIRFIIHHPQTVRPERLIEKCRKE